MRLRRVAFDHPDAARLRDQMVAEVSAMYVADRARQNRDGGTGVDPSTVVMTAVGYDSDEPVAHVTLRRIDAGFEIKRMFIVPAHRGRGWGARLLEEAEVAAVEAGAQQVLLHTGTRQAAAIALYTARGYLPIDLYPPYLDVPDSLCFGKDVRP